MSGRAAGPLEFLAFLLSSVYDNSLDSQHRADLHRSGLSDNTIERQCIRTVPPDMIEPLLGFSAPLVRSAYVLPFADPRGGWMDHVRLKVFGDADAEIRGAHVEQHRGRWRYNGGRIKYLVRRRATPRLFFPLATMTPTLAGTGALWAVEGQRRPSRWRSWDSPSSALNPLSAGTSKARATCCLTSTPLCSPAVPSRSRRTLTCRQRRNSRRRCINSQKRLSVAARASRS